MRTPHPLRVAPRVAAPLLVVAGAEDVLCPPGPAAELADRAPHGELALLPCGHFDLYDGAGIELETAFLIANLTE